MDLVDGTLLPNVDGISLAPILLPHQNRTQPLRHSFMVEHQGEVSETVKGCPQYAGQGMDVSYSQSTVKSVLTTTCISSQ